MTTETEKNSMSEIHAANADVEIWLHVYQQMAKIRTFEENVNELYQSAKMPGLAHLYSGQEAVAVGVCETLRRYDYITSTHRGHGHCLAKGASIDRMFAELLGREAGYCKGKGGSMHIFDKEKNFFGGHGIVGGQIPLGAGIAFAEKYNKTKNLCMCYMGDGAVRQGAFHETLNYAMLWKLPVIFVIENNGYAMGTSVQRSSNVHELYTLGEAFDMPSEPVDAMTPEAVHIAVAKAAERARAGEGPTLLEFRTYRYKGHSMSDPAKYRTKEEVEEYKGRDPIEVVKKAILAKKFATEKQLEEIDQKILDRVEDSVKFAEESKFPDPSEALKDIYAQSDYPYINE